MKKILLFLPFFLIFQMQAYFCPLHNHFAFTHALQSIDCKSHRLYPVAKPDNQVCMVVVPAGHDEQAQCLIAATYRVLEEQLFDKIIVLCPCDILFHGIALPCLIDDDSYLQNVSIKTDVVEKLSEYELFHYYQVPFCHNIVLEQQCQFLEFYNKKNIPVIPLVVGQISQDDACDIAVIIANCCIATTLIVLSADIACHDHVMSTLPFDQSKICKVYDQDVCRIQAVQSGSLQQQVALFDDEQHSSLFAVLFELLQLPHFKNLASDFVGYATSYDDTNLNDCNVQSYGAFIFQTEEQLGYKNNIGSYEQSQLLQIARTALQDLFAVRTCRLPSMMSYEMSQSHGIFVSLFGMSDHGKILRGCMGKVQTKLPLYDMVYQMAQQAACKDVRFYPLREKDLDSTIASLSLITDFAQVIDSKKIGEFDGIVLRYDDKEAIALPKKLSTENWNYESSLIDLSEQISSTRRFLWKKPRAQIFTFHSVVFQEE